MPITSRQLRVLAAALLSLAVALTAGALAAPAALAGSPATVSVRVLGPAPSYQALTPITEVATTTAPVTKEGDSCSGVNAIGALNLATGGNWSGKFEGNEWLITAIDGETFDGPEYWGFWVNNRYAAKGLCAQELEPGAQLLLYPENLPSGCFETPKKACVVPRVLSIEAPADAEVGQPTSVTVLAYPNGGGELSTAPPVPAAGVNVGGWGSSTTTNAEGKATIIFPGDETYTLRATAAAEEQPAAVPGEALVCAHTGDDGECGTPRPTGNTPPVGTNPPVQPLPAAPTGPPVVHITGIHAHRAYRHGRGPRVLAGTITAPAPVTSIALRLRRSYHGRCWAYDGRREQLGRARCGKGAFFQVASGGDSFSYLLPARLPAGHYVLEVAASDSASGAPQDRGSSRVVFDVE
jgi:hypothetical protein